MCCKYTVYSGMQEWVIQIPSIPILVSVIFPSLHLRIKFLLLVLVTKDFVANPTIAIQLTSGCIYVCTYAYVAAPEACPHRKLLKFLHTFLCTVPSISEDDDGLASSGLFCV